MSAHKSVTQNVGNLNFMSVFLFILKIEGILQKLLTVQKFLRKFRIVHVSPVNFAMKKRFLKRVKSFLKSKIFTYANFLSFFKVFTIKKKKS